MAAVALPLTFAHGAIAFSWLIGALPVAATWLGSLLLSWRTRNYIWSAPGFIALLFGSRWIGIHDPHVPTSLSLQWLCIVVIIAGAPLLFFRPAMLRVARLEKASEVPPAP